MQRGERLPCFKRLLRAVYCACRCKNRAQHEYWPRQTGCASCARRCGALEGLVGLGGTRMRRGPVTRQQELGLGGLMRCCPPAAILVVPGGVGNLAPAQLLLGWSTRMHAAMQPWFSWKVFLMMI